MAAEVRARQDGQVEDLQMGKRPHPLQVVQSAADRVHAVAGQTEDHVQADIDALVEHGADARLEGREVRAAAHQPLGPRIERLQADFHFLEVGRPQQPGGGRVDALGAEFAGEGQPPLGIALGEPAQEVEEIGPLVQRRIEQEDLGDLVPGRMGRRLAAICSGESSRRAACPLG